jgi:hypothetical protein
MIRSQLKFSLSLLCMSLVALGSQSADASPAVQSTGSGTGVFFPATGYYFGPGSATPFGDLIYSGTLELDEIQPGKFRFQNAGRGTENESFHEVSYEDGSTISTRFRGIVELVPVLENGNPTGQFTANWDGNWTIVEGTGQLRGAKGGFRVNAINDPFSLTDEVWTFSWSWQGNVTVPNRPDDCTVLRLTTNGEGTFDPANLGLGDPTQIPFPFIIGDGSGEGIYDGTPTGEFSLDGVVIGPDQHFGTAQSISPGVLSPVSTIWYPGRSGENPDGSGRLIHIMRTEPGEIWFEYTHFFELDSVAGLIIGLADFRVVGGTGLFEGATGSVFVRVESNLADVTGLPANPVAPFTYDFKGYVTLCEEN